MYKSVDPKADFPKLEEEVLNFWQENDTFKKSVAQREGAEDLVRKLTGLPENFTVLCVMSLGYKNEERKPFDFEKLQYEKVCQID